MTTLFQVREEIRAPRGRVFAALTDLDAMRTWMGPDVLGVVRLTDGPLAAETEFCVTRRLLDRDGDTYYRVLALEPDGRLELTWGGSLRLAREETYRYEYVLEAPGDDLTTLVLSCRAVGMGRLFAAFMRLMTRSLRGDATRELAGLRAYLERG